MTRWPLGRDRHRDPARADTELEHPSTRPVRQRSVQVHIARVVGKIQIVEPGERRGGRLGGALLHALTSARTHPPALRFTASALIASSASRFAAIAVVSAWS